MTPDDAGGQTISDDATTTTVCRMVGLGSTTGAINAEVAERLGDRVAYRLSLPYAIEPSLTDFATVDSRKFELLSVSRPPGATLTRCIVAEVAS